MKQITKYAATDGTVHDTAVDARCHEDGAAIKAMVGLTEGDVQDAIAGRVPTTRDAIRRVYGMIQEARKEAGEVRPRGSKKAIQAAPAVAKEPVPRKARAA